MRGLTRDLPLLMLTAGVAFLTGCPRPSNGRGDNNPLLREALSVSENDAPRAMLLLEKALAGEPGLAEAHRQLGNLHYENTHDYAAAIYHFQKYLQLDTNSQWRPNIDDQIERSRLELARRGLGSVRDIDAERRLQSLMADKEALQGQIKQLEQEKAALAAQLETLRNEARAGSRGSANAAGENPGRNDRATTPRDRSTERAETPPPRQATTPRTHRVQRGETFYSIGRAYGFSADEMIRANPGVPASGLHVGQEVRLPR
ncbi:MAG: LysM peptidoglycan-binding domain-containing protein [Verrucomicrobiales bacterium]|nr:LysM peptidoglycan-binding domain-containing protein [Verrucomicrobiales bacterium]